VPASRLPLAADALDLWVEITANVHGWADLLHIDRRPYRAAERVQFEREERLPGWLRRLWQWTGPAGEMLAPLPVLPPAIHRLAVEDHDPLADRTVPPVGQLLRAVAARAATLAVDEVTDRIAYKAHSWADRIRTMLGGVQADDHIYPIRGATCPACGAFSVLEARDGERYQVPAVQVRFMPLDGGEPDDLWAYRMCVACGDNGWVDYTSETPVTSLDTPPSEAA
jgi:hypothetical protein